MQFTGVNIKDGKMRGEWAELRFMARASEQGLGVSKPWGDSRAYDFIIEHQGKLLRGGKIHNSRQIPFVCLQLSWSQQPALHSRPH